MRLSFVNWKFVFYPEAQCNFSSRGMLSKHERHRRWETVTKNSTTWVPANATEITAEILIWSVLLSSPRFIDNYRNTHNLDQNKAWFVVQDMSSHFPHMNITTKQKHVCGKSGKASGWCRQWGRGWWWGDHLSADPRWWYFMRPYRVAVVRHGLGT